MDGESVALQVADPHQWAERQFGSCQLGDARRTCRLVHSAAKIAAQPEKAFTQTLDWNELRGFYNLCDQAQASLAAVQGPHWQLTRQAMAQQPLVLIVHDTTCLDFSSHRALKGAGPIGNNKGTGFLQHNSLAIVPQDRQVLGLAYQQLRVRKRAPRRETSYQMRQRRQRETQMWWQGISASGEAPAGCCWVDVGDRGSDIYECMVAARQAGHHFLFRVTKDRGIYRAAGRQQAARMKSFARSLLSQGTDTVEIPGRGGRPARTAVVALAAAPVWIPAPKEARKRRSQPILPAYVIRLWEPEPPPGVEALEWLLVCSVPTTTLEEIKERRDWYACRWLVELYHDVEKNGCSQEARRFETAERMETCLALLSVVAVRVLQLRSALQWQPEAPAQQVATATEITVLRQLSKHQDKSFTVRAFVRGVAKLGGFLGRKHDGEPGVRALWRGYQRLQDMIAGFQLHSPPATPRRSW